MQDVELSWSEQLIEDGRREGRESGILEGKRSTLLRQLERKFGPLPDSVADHIAELDAAGVDALIDRVLTAASLAEMGL